MLTELSLSLVAYIGVFLGLLLSKITGKEVSKGKNNLKIFRNALFAIALIWFFYASQISLIVKIIAIVIVVVVATNTDHIYGSLGLLMGLQPEFIMSSLAFLYGFPIGSLMQGKSIKEVFLATYSFLVFTALSYAVLRVFL